MSPRSVASACPHAQPAACPCWRPGADRGRRGRDVRDDGRDRPLARRHVQGAARDERDDAGRARSSSGIVVDLETGVRGYMLTDDESFLEPYRSGRSGSTRQPRRARATCSRPSLRPRVARDHARPRRLHPRVHRAADPGHARPSVLAATTEGKQRLDALRAEFAALSSAAAGDHRASAATDSQALRHAHARARRRRRRALGRAAGRCSASACTASCCCRSAASRRAAEQPRPRATSTRASRPPAPARSASSAPRSTRWPAALAARERGPARPDRPPAGDPRPHHDDDLGQGPRRPLPARQRRVAAAMGQVGVDVIGRTDDELFPPDIAAAIRVTDLEILRTRRGRRVRARRRHRRPRVPARQVPAQGRRRRASTPPARWAPTSASASARWPRPSRPRARSPSSWPT